MIFRNRDKKILNFPDDFFWREMFYFFSTLWLAFIVLEIIFPNIILVYFNINYLFLIVIISGLVALLKEKNKN